ncbi:hypothetical protein SAMN04488121_1011312 [Chitinophaga filiformis]|uniref:Uncharacterized protein n=1 Tax=Chitinophaga filiformis TaxID=104663 RepID=A0A1G7JNQ6_CHIFI|nr:hypothetical protein SAMN04488121_1011312 [Chitinophaga filiformis]
MGYIWLKDSLYVNNGTERSLLRTVFHPGQIE